MVGWVAVIVDEVEMKGTAAMGNSYLQLVNKYLYSINLISFIQSQKLPFVRDFFVVFEQQVL
jgi:hypothetical protein